MKQGQGNSGSSGGSWAKENVLLISTIVGVAIGVGLGFSLRPLNLSEFWLQLLSYPGELFTRALQCCILPLIISSLIVGSASLDAKLNGKIALRTMLYFVSTSLFNAILGVILVVVIHPGSPEMKMGLGGASGSHFVEERKNTLMDNFLDLGRNVIPSNIFTAMFQQTQTVYEPAGRNGNVGEYVRTIVLRDGTNTLGIITFALGFGAILGSMGARAKPVIEAFRVIDDVIMNIVKGVMFVTPVGVSSLILSKILSVQNISAVIAQLGMFVLTVLIGVLFYQWFIQPLIYLILKRKNPLKFYIGVMPANITAFTTASTAVALPVSFKCLEEQGVDHRVAQFVLPIGATVNKDGTAMFVSIASVFIAQMNGVPLGIGELATVTVASTAVSIASASVPSAALALMFIVLNAIQVPTSDIGLLFAVDWLVDRIRTTNNLLGDLYAAVAVEHFSQKELKIMDEYSYTSSSASPTGSPAHSMQINVSVSEDFNDNVQDHCNSCGNRNNYKKKDDEFTTV